MGQNEPSHLEIMFLGRWYAFDGSKADIVWAAIMTAFFFCGLGVGLGFGYAIFAGG